MISYPRMLKQDPAQIAMTSPRVERLRANLPPGSRDAVVAPGVSVLPPNPNATLGLASVHGYNSLSSTRYHTLIKELGGDVQAYGRWNAAIALDYSGPVFWMSNISLLLSAVRLAHSNLECMGERSGIHLYRMLSRMGENLRVASKQPDAGSKKLLLDNPRTRVTNRPLQILDQSDVVEFEVTPPSHSSVFLLSKKVHRDWQVRASIKEGWQAAQTVESNDVFQGVTLPPEARRGRFDFRPLAGYAWIARVFWLFSFLLIVFCFVRTSRCQALERV